jgi:hypothetical protein
VASLLAALVAVRRLIAQRLDDRRLRRTGSAKYPLVISDDPRLP